jgi:hypothetical protein
MNSIWQQTIKINLILKQLVMHKGSKMKCYQSRA